VALILVPQLEHLVVRKRGYDVDDRIWVDVTLAERINERKRVFLGIVDLYTPLFLLPVASAVAAAVPIITHATVRFQC
jgi:hypothetical protein